MGAFDSNESYSKNPYNVQQRMKSVTWILISVIFGCVFIAKRLYFKSEKERLKKDNPQTDFVDVMSDIILCLLILRLIFGPPNPAIMSVLMTIFMMGLVISVGFVLRLLWNMRYKKKIT